MKQRDKKFRISDFGFRNGKPLERAEEILCGIRTLRIEIDLVREGANAEMAKVRDRHQKAMSPLLEDLAGYEKELTALMKRERAEIFGEKDKIGLVHGFLFYARRSRLSLPRDALDRIEAQGWTEAIRIAKSVDRAMVESWSDEKLSAIGAARKLIESFSYEVKEGG